MQKSAMAGRRFGLFFALGLLCSAPAWALDYLSVAQGAAMYDAPSTKAKPLYVVQRDTPVEQLVVSGAWVKVRDSEGALVWLEKSSLSEKRTVLVRAERAQVRAAAADTAPLVFEAERRVVLDLVEPASGGWAKVKHRDGQSGFVKVTQVWGL
jgi:SH3-like domain-containing protein